MPSESSLYSQQFRRRRGAALVEVALTVSILTSLVFGAVEFSQYLHVKTMLEQAARQGARAGVSPAAKDSDVTTAALGALPAANFPSGSATISTTDASGHSESVTALPVSTPIKITVSATWGTVGSGYRLLGLIPASKVVSGVCVMRKGG